MYDKIVKKIEEYDDIAIYRHINPDFDAFGSLFRCSSCSFVIDSNTPSLARHGAQITLSDSQNFANRDRLSISQMTTESSCF